VSGPRCRSTATAGGRCGRSARRRKSPDPRRVSIRNVGRSAGAALPDRTCSSKSRTASRRSSAIHLRRDGHLIDQSIDMVGIGPLCGRKGGRRPSTHLSGARRSHHCGPFGTALPRRESRHSVGRFIPRELGRGRLGASNSCREIRCRFMRRGTAGGYDGLRDGDGGVYDMARGN